ncbi:MAG TPA: hypothetical protein VFS01_14595 [Rhizomicrobium sp.]|nr:hypothetical protein [Rhizomicrobium sp.]
MDTRLKSRAAGASLTLLVQAGLLLPFLASQIPTALRPITRETVLWLHPPHQQAPPAPDATRGPASTPHPVPFHLPPTFALPPTPESSSEPDVAGFGRMLFGCTPQTYADLPPDQKARCPEPGEGLQVRTEPDLMGMKSHVKDEARWQREWARVHGPILLPCGGFVDVVCLLAKIANGTLDDYGSPDRWPVYATKNLSPQNFHEIEEAYDAWHRDHPVK